MKTEYAVAGMASLRDTASRQRLVVIGNGMAGMRTVEELLKIAPGLYDITVFGAEPHGNYNRILLSPMLAGEKTVDDIILNTREWYDANGITLHAGDAVIGIDRARRIVRSQKGVEARYDRLLIATGSKPFIAPTTMPSQVRSTRWQIAPARHRWCCRCILSRRRGRAFPDPGTPPFFGTATGAPSAR